MVLQFVALHPNYYPALAPDRVVLSKAISKFIYLTKQLIALNYKERKAFGN